MSNINGGNKAKHWCLTLCISEDLGAVNTIDAYQSTFNDIQEFLDYAIVGEETGEGGLHHLQCYIVGKKQITRPTLRKWFGDHGNSYSVARGTPQQNKVYCSKDNNFTEFGVLPEDGRQKGGQATASKWGIIRDLALKQDLPKLSAEHPKEFIQNYRTLKQIGFDFCEKKENLTKPCGEWITGVSGIGKSFTARTENPGAYIKMMNKWWDNYKNEDVVILEDFDPGYAQSMAYFLKIWADSYVFPAEIKNHKVDIRPKKFIVTSQYTPSECFTDKNTLDAIERRFKIRILTKLSKTDDKGMISQKSNPKRKDPPPKKHDAKFLQAPKKWKATANGKGIELNKVPPYPKIDDLYDALEEHTQSPDTQVVECTEEIIISSSSNSYDSGEEEGSVDLLVDSDDLDSSDLSDPSDSDDNNQIWC